LGLHSSSVKHSFCEKTVAYGTAVVANHTVCRDHRILVICGADRVCMELAERDACAVLSHAADNPWLSSHVQLCSRREVAERFVAVLAGLFKGAVGK